jgi:tRNA modification GTPase
LAARGCGRAHPDDLDGGGSLAGWSPPAFALTLQCPRMQAGDSVVQGPALQDTIVAVSSAWQPAPLGIVRLSGPDAVAIVATIGVRPPKDPARPALSTSRVALDVTHDVPAQVLWFAAPRTYTGQDVVELHLPGSLPLLRMVCDRLIAAGARRALPGEFTARALLTGRLDVAQAEGVLGLIEATRVADVRQAARQTQTSQPGALEALRERLLDLLTRIEAGIDFAEEEDVRFVTAAEVAATLDAALVQLDALGRRAAPLRSGRPHVALAGLPNAGKSTLFNALLGTARAIVSPVLGTTRDVLAAETAIDGVDLVLQDCAGLGASQTELEAAAHLATERAADEADLVLWVHAADQLWTPAEVQACGRLSPERRVLVVTKTDLRDAADAVPLEFAVCCRSSALRGVGIEALRATIAAQVRLTPAATLDAGSDWGAVRAILTGARALVDAEAGDLDNSELVALELRAALERLAGAAGARVDELVLARVYARFCVGK